MATELDAKRKDFEKARKELAMAEKDRKNLPPVKRVERDPENNFRSKAQFIAERRRKREEEADAKEYIAKKKETKEVKEEVVEEVPQEPVVVEKKRRPKKIE